MDFATFLIQMNSLKLLLPHEVKPANVPTLTVPVESVINPDTITYNGEPIDVGPQIRYRCWNEDHSFSWGTGWYEIQKNHFVDCEPDTQ